ncbi:hypothetical protein COU54_05805 [Candidatus Pacearchaeota archaeon CG10_big_fil_rev_8_21_14_0_10_31_24]|nr:MAG: hypothetical protein COU54_05805 [Candidatus Pacearchaeota archaeon CG10_big_fil_rev_8_21_14_0_10_31_24]
MAKKKSVVSGAVEKTGSALAMLISLILWVVGILIALAVGFGMTSGVLVIPSIPSVLTVSAGWIVVVLTLLGAILAIIEKAKR